MRRWPLRVLVCLVLGAITTVAVAWGCAYWQNGTNWFKPHVDREGRWYSIENRASVTVKIDAAFGRTAVLTMAHTYPTDSKVRYPGGQVRDAFADLIEKLEPRSNEFSSPLDVLPYWETWSEPLIRSYWSDLSVDQSHYAFATGWPFRAFFFEYDDVFSRPTGYGAPGAFRIDSTHERYGRPMTEWHFIPYRVLPLGFTLNTLFYAAIWFGLFFGFAGTKRFLRVKRGRCPRCGYDLRGGAGLVAGCPECGAGRMEAADHASR